MLERPWFVAIVDDDPRVRDALSELFESAGYRVLLYASASHFLSAEFPPRIDCMVTDISMPGVDGIELRKVVRSKRPELPVFLITGRHELIEKLPREERVNIFMKPFDSSALLFEMTDQLTNA